VIYTH